MGDTGFDTRPRHFEKGACRKEQSTVEKLKTRHDQIMSRVRDLETKDRTSKALEQATASIKAADSALNTGGVDSGIDDVSQRIEARNDVAQEEFKRASGELDGPEDPLKKQEVDDIIAELKQPTAAA